MSGQTFLYSGLIPSDSFIPFPSLRVPAETKGTHKLREFKKVKRVVYKSAGSM